MKLRTVLVGLGAIGSRNDHGQRHQSPLSHAGAIFRNPDFELVAAVDPDQGRREAFRRDWGGNVPLLSSLNDLSAYELDLAVIASSTPTHYPVLHEVLSWKKVKAIFCEKPFCSELSDTKYILATAEKQGTGIVVNYHRRWDPKITRFKREIASYGLPNDVQVVYRKGLYNYGSHIIDLMVSFFGPVISVRADALTVQQPVPDDPSISATIDFTSGARARLNGCDGVDYDLFDMDISFHACRFRLEAGGYRIRKMVSVPDVYFSGYSHLQETDAGYEDGPVAGLQGAYRELAAFLQGGAAPTISTGNNAFHVAQVLDAVRRSSQENGKKVAL